MSLVNWLWIIFAAAFALAGLIVLLRAIFADRSRGRKRCPKCWYDMTGATSLACTECGREARSKRRLYRTRRHWRAALLGILLIVIGLSLYAGGEVHRNGWVRATPTVGYIAALPWLDQKTTLGELNNRINSGELREWEYRFLMHRCIGILKSSDDPQVILRPVQLISAVDSAYRYKRSNQPWGNWYSVFVGRGDEVMDELIALLNHPDARVRIAVLDCFKRLSFGSSRILPAVLARFLDEDPKIRKSARSLLQFIGADPNGVRFQAGMAALMPLRQLELDQDSDSWRTFEVLCNELADSGSDFERAISVLKAGMHSQHAVLQDLSIYALTGCQSQDPQVRDEVLRRFDSADHIVRQIALAATPAFPLDDRVRKVIRWGLQQADTESMALQVIAARGREAEEYCPDLQQRFASLSDGIFDAAVSAYCQIGGDPEVAVNACLDRFQHSVAARAYGSRPAGEIDLIARVGAGSPKVINVLE